MTASKVMSLRLSERQADEIAAIARTDGVPITEAIREAINGHVTSRRSDPEFQKRLRRRLEEDQVVLESLREK
jgi:hypothetical protein